VCLYFFLSFLSALTFLFRHFFWYENVCWREELERLGMSSDELNASLIAEREECVASLPYHHADDEWRCIDEEQEQEAEAEAGEEGDSAGGKRNVRSRSGSRAHSDGHHSVPASPLRPSASEFPLCPSRSPGVRVHVFLAANDDISPGASIRAYLAASERLQERKWGAGRSMLRCTVFPDVGHAEALFHPDMRSQIVECVQTQRSHKQLRDEADAEAAAPAAASANKRSGAAAGAHQADVPA